MDYVKKEADKMNIDKLVSLVTKESKKDNRNLTIRKLKNMGIGVAVLGYTAMASVAVFCHAHKVLPSDYICKHEPWEYGSAILLGIEATVGTILAIGAPIALYDFHKFMWGKPKIKKEHSLAKLTEEQIELLKEEYKNLDKYYNEIEFYDREKVIKDNFKSFEKYFDIKDDAKKINFDPNDLSEKSVSLLEHALEHYNKPSILREYHAETVMQFVDNHKYDLDLFRMEQSMIKIADWPKERFIEYGCKTFDIPKK